MIRAHRWRLAQVLLFAALLVWIGRELVQQREALRAAAGALEVRWGLIAAASLLVLLTYAALIQSWRMLMAGWGTSLSYGAAVRVWTTAKLGLYIPGKVWSVGALAVLAQREGASAIGATGAALLGTLLNIGAGFGVVALVGPGVLDAMGAQYRNASWIALALFVVVVLLLPRLLPPVVRAIAARRAGLSEPVQPLPAVLVWGAVGINAASWIGYGLAFRLLAQAMLPGVSGAALPFIAIWTASYLVGYLVLVAPGGIGAREGAMVAAFGALGLAGPAEATIVAVASRLWLLVLEVLPGLISLALAPGTRSRSP
jgi:uncharacterized membrane protein YbhN (UPF0104 family)